MEKYVLLEETMVKTMAKLFESHGISSLQSGHYLLQTGPETRIYVVC